MLIIYSRYKFVVGVLTNRKIDSGDRVYWKKKNKQMYNQKYNWAQFSSCLNFTTPPKST